MTWTHGMLGCSQTWMFEAASNDITTLDFAVTSPRLTGNPAQQHVQSHKHTGYVCQQDV